MTLTDELLLKYVDGLLDAATAHAVEVALARDEIAAERLRLIRASGRALRDAAGQSLEPLNAKAVERLIGAPSRPAPMNDGAAPSLAGSSKVARAVRPVAARRSILRWSGGATAVAAGLALLLATGAGYWIGRGSIDRPETRHPVWVVRVADYHALYGRQTVEPVRTAAADVAGLEARFGQVLGRPVKIPRFDAAMEFRRGQLLEFERDAILQLAYLPAEGTPMALCLRRSDAADAAAMFELINGIGMVRWRQGGLDYVLVGHQSETELRGFAAKARAQITGATRS